MRNIVCLCLAALIFQTAIPAPCATYRVNPDGTADYPYILAALLAATSGDTVLCEPAVYSHYFDRGLYFSGEAIVLTSEVGPESTIIDCQNLDRAFTMQGGETSATVIQGFTVRNGRADAGGAMYLYGSSPTVRDMIFSHNTATSASTSHGGGAVYCRYGAAPTFTDVIFYRNEANRGGAIYSYGGAKPVLTNCTLVANGSTYDGAVRCSSDSLTLENSIIAYSYPGKAMLCTEGSGSLTTHSLVFGNLGGDAICGEDVENLSEDPLFCDWDYADLEVCADSPCLPENNPYGVTIGARGLGDCSCPERIVVSVPGDYGTIGEALAVAGWGDTVWVHPGIYYEDSLIVRAGTALLSVAGRDSTTIDATGGGPVLEVGYILDGGRVEDVTVIDGFTITGSTDSGIKIVGGLPTIANCRVIGNSAGGGGGIRCVSASPLLSNVEFIDNEATLEAIDDGGGGLYCGNGSRPTVEACVFRGNTGFYGGAVHLYNGSSATISGCTVIGNTGSVASGIYCRNSSPGISYCVLAFGGTAVPVVCSYSNPSISRCVVTGNWGGDDLCGNTSGNIFADPLFCDWESGSLTVCEDSPCLPENNGFGVPVGVVELGDCDCPNATALEVPTEYLTIAEALAAAAPSDTVLVHPGTYYESALPLGWGVRLMSSSGPEATVIDAGGSGAVVIMGYQGKPSGRSIMRLEGFTITGGTDSGVRIGDAVGTIEDCIIVGNSGADGGGVSAESAVISLGGCMLAGNTATGSGGGVYGIDSFITMIDCFVDTNTVWLRGGGACGLNSDLTLIDCGFRGNETSWDGGAVYAEGSTLAASGCRFESNTVPTFSQRDGGAIMCVGCDVAVESCEFTGNSAGNGGALLTYDGATLAVEDCLFSGNEAAWDEYFEGGGAIHCHGETLAVIEGSTFYANAGERGGAIYTRGQAAVAIDGCTFVGNESLRGSGLFIRNAAPQVTNSLFAGGLSSEAYFCADDAFPVTRFCNIYGNATGDSLCGARYLNLFTDPAFCDTTGGVFHLEGCSPCIGGGQGGADIGAWGVGCPCGDPTGLDDADAWPVTHWCAPNPSAGGATIHYVVPEGTGRAEVTVYDVCGRVVARVLDSGGRSLERSVTWRGLDSDGSRVGAGVYFYEIRAGHKTLRGRMVVLR
jgi:hypothetical protein